MAVVLIAAAVLSFSALRDLAIQVRVPIELAWLMPICVDAGAAVATNVWLSRRNSDEAERFARRLTWALLTLTVAGNATHQGLTAAGIVPPWWVAVLVGAIPAGVVGSVVHLAVLVGRKAEVLPVFAPAPELTPEPVWELLAGEDTSEHQPDTSEHQDDLEERARAMAAAGVGRPTLVKELGIKDHVAKRLVREARQVAP